MKALWLFAAVVVVWALPITGQAQQQNDVEEEENYVTCNLSGDPELSTFTSQRGSIPLPCFYHMADLRLEFKEDSPAAALYDFIIVDIFVSADMRPYTGRYFAGSVSIEIGGYKYIDGTNAFRLVDEGTYMTNSGNVETFLNSDQTSQDEAAVWDINSTFPANFINTGYETAEKSAFLKLTQQNNPPLEINFRPRDKSQGIPQSPKPGVFVRARKARLKGQPEARFPDTFCSTKSDDRTFREIKKLPRYGERLIRNRELMLYTAYTQAVDQDIDQTQPKCIDAVAAFKNCIGEAKRQQAMRICSPLTTAKAVRCLEGQDSEPGNALVAFTKCVNVCCDVDKVSSQSWLDEAAATCPLALHTP